MTDLEPLWAVADVMTYLKRGRTWVYDQVANGTLPHLERAAAAGEDMPEEEAIETVRLVLKEWKRRGWL